MGTSVIVETAAGWLKVEYRAINIENLRAGISSSITVIGIQRTTYPPIWSSAANLATLRSIRAESNATRNLLAT